MLGLFTVTQVFFREFDHIFQNTYFTERLSLAASKIHKFPTSFMKLILEMKLLFNLNMFKVNNKDTRTTSIDLAPVLLL